MHGSMSWKSFQASCHIDQIVNILLFFIRLLQFRIHGQSFINSDIQLLRNHFCNISNLCIWHIQNTANIPNHTTGCQSTKSNNLDHTVIPIFTADIFNNLLPSFEAEVNVNIRHRYSFRIQKSLKEQIIANRIKLCDAQGISNQTSRCRATSRSYHNVMIAGIFNKIPYYKEVIHVAHIFYSR